MNDSKAKSEEADSPINFNQVGLVKGLCLAFTVFLEDGTDRPDRRIIFKAWRQVFEGKAPKVAGKAVQVTDPMVVEGILIIGRGLERLAALIPQSSLNDRSKQSAKQVVAQCSLFTKISHFQQPISDVSKELSKDRIEILWMIEEAIDNQFPDTRMDANSLEAVAATLREALAEVTAAGFAPELKAVLEPLLRWMLVALASYEYLGATGLQQVAGTAAAVLMQLNKDVNLKERHPTLSRRLGSALSGLFKGVGYFNTGIAAAKNADDVGRFIGNNLGF